MSFLVWPLANLRHRPWISGATLGGVAVAAFLVATLLGFVRGYEQAVRRDVDKLGFDLLVTARGCPYEAATLMLRGGVGLRYMQPAVVARLEQEPAVTSVHPQLIHPVRDPASPGGMILMKGVEPSLAAVQGLELASGAWLDAGPGVVLGFEAAELEARRPGDAWNVPGTDTRLPVLGVLERTGTQLDGTVLMELRALQELFELGDRLTGVGIRIDPDRRHLLPDLRQRYDDEAELQVIALDKVVEALRLAMDQLRDVVNLLAGFLAVLAALVLLNAALLRALTDHRQLLLLRAIGLPFRFLAAAALTETLLLVLAGTTTGLGAASALGLWSSRLLIGYLPYEPKGNLILLDAASAWGMVAAAVGLGVLATLPALYRVRASVPDSSRVL